MCPCQSEVLSLYCERTHKRPVFLLGGGLFACGVLGNGLDGFAFDALDFREGEADAPPEPCGDDSATGPPAAEGDGMDTPAQSELLGGEELRAKCRG